MNEVTHTRRINHRVWLEDVCKLVATAFVFVIIDRMAMANGYSDEVILKLLGATSQIGYLLLAGVKLLEHNNPRYWIYTEIKTS